MGSHRVTVDGIDYQPLSQADPYLQPRPYVAANLHALLTALRPHGFDTGDWFGQLIYWAEQNGAAQSTPNADYEAKLKELACSCG